MQHLPSLTNFGGQQTAEELLAFLRHLLFSSLDTEPLAEANGNG